MSAQGFGGSGITVGIAAAALLAEDLTGSQGLAGLAQTTQVLASAVAAYGLLPGAEGRCKPRLWKRARAAPGSRPPGLRGAATCR